MIYTAMTKKAMKLCIQMHGEQKDKSGFPYYLHPIHVAESATNENECVVALLHDIVEDTPMTLKDLEAEGFNDEVIEAIDCLTHRRNESYFDYINRIKENQLASKIKVNDLHHNSELGRLDNISNEDLERIEKYKKALGMLS